MGGVSLASEDGGRAGVWGCIVTVELWEIKERKKRGGGGITPQMSVGFFFFFFFSFSFFFD